MPQKPTKREKKEDAKKRRLEELRRRQRRARRRKVMTMVVLALIVLGILAGILAVRAGQASARTASIKLAASGGCTQPLQFPMEGREHVNPPQSVQYKTDPATSGAHYNVAQPQSPASTGVHATELPGEVTVHNLEHGHVVIQYQPGALTDKQLTELSDLVKKDPQWVLMAPRRNKTAKLSLTAWTIKQDCNDPNDNIGKVAANFIKRFKNQGPESVPGAKPVFEQPSPTPSPAATGPAGKVIPAPKPKPKPSK